MNFLSLTFLVAFSILFILFWMNRNLLVRQLLLLLASYLFYGWVHPWLAVFLFIYTLVNYFISAKLGERENSRNAFYRLGLVINIGLLLFFKYFAFIEISLVGILQGLGLQVQPAGDSLLVPIGISFFTLQMVSYLTDLYRSTLSRERELLTFGLYVGLFTKITAGPIERGKALLPQLSDLAHWSWARFNEGVYLVILGYLYKVMIADNIGAVVDKVFILQKPSLLVLGAGAVAFTLQIYADFAAYTNLARGFGKLLGIEHVENFNSPYLSTTPSDFWQRWHISFSSWLRDYVFYPVRRWVLALKAPGPLQVILPAIITMLVSGVWHGVGWTFLLWGLYFGILLAIYQIMNIDGRLRNAGRGIRFLAWAVNFGLIIFGWLLFRAPSVPWLLNALVKPIYGGSQDALITGAVILVLTLFYAIPMFVDHGVRKLAPKLPMLEPLVYAAAAVLLLAFLQLGGTGGQEFIYFNF